MKCFTALLIWHHYYIDYTLYEHHKNDIKTIDMRKRKWMKRRVIKNVNIISAYALQIITMIFLNLYEMLFLYQCDMIVIIDINHSNIIEILQIWYTLDMLKKLKFSQTIRKKCNFKIFPYISNKDNKKIFKNVRFEKFLRSKCSQSSEIS